MKKAGFLTKIVILALLIAASVSLLRMQGMIANAQEELDAARRQAAEQTRINAELRDAVEHNEDPARQRDIARNELGLVAPGEKVIIFTD